MIVGATADTDHQILNLTQALYRKYRLKRVFFSAYVPMRSHALLPTMDTKPPLLREHRLYQADWLLRKYGFDADELLDEQHPNFNPYLDPKCNWALNHLDCFPVEANTAPYEMLLRVPGIGEKSARRILIARRTGKLDFDGLKRIGVVLKRAQYFLTCRGKAVEGLKMSPDAILRALLSQQCAQALARDTGIRLGAYGLDWEAEQLSLFGSASNRLMSGKMQELGQEDLLPIAQRLANREYVSREERLQCVVGQF